MNTQDIKDFFWGIVWANKKEDGKTFPEFNEWDNPNVMAYGTFSMGSEETDAYINKSYQKQLNEAGINVTVSCAKYGAKDKLILRIITSNSLADEA